MEAVFLKLLNMSITAGWLVLAILLLRLLLRKAPKAMRCVLWALVGIRLLCPVSLESALSLIPSAQPVPQTVLYTAEPAVDSGVPAIDQTVDPPISAALSPEAGASVNPMQMVTFIASIIWIVGMAAMLLYAFISFLRVDRKVREAMPLNGNIWLCDHIDTPFILGILRPRIFLPSSMDEGDRAFVVAHEEAHLKRHDHWWKPLGFVLLSVYWFNPLLWVAYILLCRDIELACDEKVIRQMGEEGKRPYSEALIHCSVPRRQIAACPLAFGEVGVKARIRTVLHYQKPAFWVVLAAAAACAVAAVCFLTDPRTSYSDEQLLRMAERIADAEEVKWSSNPYDYIRAERATYDKLLSAGDDTVDCFVRALRATEDSGLREYIMAAACADITGVGRKSDDEDTVLWATAKEWLTLYDGGAVSHVLEDGRVQMTFRVNAALPLYTCTVAFDQWGESGQVPRLSVQAAGSDTVLQDIRFPYGETAVSADSPVRLADVNFDGNTDILVPCDSGASGSFRCFAWRPASGRFVEIPTFSVVRNPVIQGDTHLLLVRSFSDQLASYSIYRFDETRWDFVRTNSLYFEPDYVMADGTRYDTGKGCWLRESVYDNGTETQVQNIYVRGTSYALDETDPLAQPYFEEGGLWELNSNKWNSLIISKAP